MGIGHWALGIGHWGKINSKFVLESLLNGGNPRTQLSAKFKIKELMGIGDRGKGKGGKEINTITNYQLPITHYHAPCPMPYAPCPMPHTHY
ncbi:hypothetical protein NIES37_52880 [Tolypothrix tenuis PCC 7101]|uniref:Uncharacterized protein n=1 Tax=Tolypothrix tenuis PCC 7101 TaxID=231146 RepID=A0A1Z4N6D1_9CYAN|nr:hypothetical protein NIES37_52880 [Tolypothrix tenuis PCC 7101]BAZ74788.1 hypothetical protein NIES50_33670 [Aulosira laxa NIES-50]